MLKKPKHLRKNRPVGLSDGRFDGSGTDCLCNCPNVRHGADFGSEVRMVCILASDSRNGLFCPFVRDVALFKKQGASDERKPAIPENGACVCRACNRNGRSDSENL